MPEKIIEVTVLPAEAKESKLTKQDEKKLKELTQQLKGKLENALKDMVSIGQDFLEIKKIVGHGRFLKHVEAHFDMSYRTVNRFMHVAEVLGPHMETVSNLSQRSLYLLSSPSLPEQIREVLIKQLQDGKALTYDEIQTSINKQQENIQQLSASSSAKRNLRIGSFSKGIGQFYERASLGLKDFSGTLTPTHKEQLIQTQAQLTELAEMIKALIDQPEPQSSPSKKSSRKKSKKQS